MKQRIQELLLLGAILFGDQPQTVDAIYKDDVGVLDFSIATAGHGAVGWSWSNDEVFLTTDLPRQGASSTSSSSSSSSSTSCYVASRTIRDGSLAWRRNVCSVPDEGTQAHSVVVGSSSNDDGSDGDALFTVDNTGIARAWTVEHGDLLWDAKVPNRNRSDSAAAAAAPKLFFVTNNSGNYAAVAASNELVFLDASTGATKGTISVPAAKDGQHIEWLFVLSSPSSDKLSMMYATVEDDDGDDDDDNDSSSDGTIRDLFVGTHAIGDAGAARFGPGKFKTKDPLVVSSWTTVGDASNFHAWAITASGAVGHLHGGNSEVLPAGSWDDSWTTVVGVATLPEDPSVVRVSGTSSSDPDAEATMKVFRYDDSTSSWKPILGGSHDKTSNANSNSNSNSAVAFAPKLGVVVTAPTGGRSVEVYDYQSGKALEIVGDVFGADGDSVAVVSVQESGSEESPNTATILIGTERGSSILFSVTKNADDNTNSVALKVLWTAEEGLANLSSAIILDASHLGSDDLVEEKSDELAYRLSIAGRLKAQWQEIGVVLSTANGLIGSSGDENNYRDHLFGFLKVSALLSSKSHKMWGMSTSGADRGSIRWSLDLPKTALWHSMVHGTTNAAKAAHGIHGDTHSREILVLSASPNKVDWMCIDGTSGAINAQDSIPITAPIQQVVPVYGTSIGGGCRQASLLLGEDLSLTVVPQDAPTNGLITNQLQKTPNGLYTHTIDKVANNVESYRVASSDNGFFASPVGMASFEGEQIVTVAYPMRHEDMQSMSTILGDNSLLLKYINPHLAVVVTVVSESDHKSAMATDVATALDKKETKRKPMGVGAPGSSTDQQQQSNNEQLPNMFVNLVDTVSGRVLYRHSHSNVDADKKISVVVSENWVIYTYVNVKRRRTEIGVLSLHEGMIQPKGLTYFAHPEQSSSFSSFDPRESSPVVLAKVYAFPKAITALGVTSTKQGISRQNILLASADGALSTINKMILETRRPVGDAKPEEKKEGLMPYKELIPESPLFSLNYNQTMEPFTKIVSATTSLESQSLVFGFGGPDLFFTRTSPTKGFDLLPETFNKVLVGGTTVGIVIALFVVKRMGTKKALKQGWS
jgi:hypothetical protein